MKYFIAINNLKKGPLTLESLRNYNLEKNTLVWKEGLEDWKPAEDFEELQDLFLSIPPPIPGVVEVSQPEVNIQKKVSKEINIILILLATTLTFTFLFYGGYSSANYPEYLTNEQIEANRELIKKYTNGNSLAPIYIGRYLPNNCKYCDDITPSLIEYGNINDTIKSNFNRDVNDKTTSAFIISIIVIFSGRYLLLGINWLLKANNS
jgi:hypothetical protein